MTKSAKSSSQQITDTERDQLCQLFHVLSHPMRLSIILILMKKECAVGELCERLDAEQHRVSQQLSILRKSELVTSRRSSRQIYYSLISPLVGNVIELLSNRTVEAEAKRTPVTAGLAEAGRFSRIV